MIVGDRKLLRALEEAEEICKDPTFSIVPRKWYQLNTIHFIINGRAFPGVTILMESKSREHYDAANSKLQEIIPNFKPKLGMADYEIVL